MKTWIVPRHARALYPPGHAQHAASASNMALLGHHDLRAAARTSR